MTGNIFLAILHLFALLHLTDQLLKLTPENGIGTLNSTAEFFVPKQCYGGMGESAAGSYRIQFHVVGKGHCQLLLCYPSQLDPNALTNGAAPEIGYYLPNNLESNPWIKNCPVEQDENWHGIYIDVDGDIVNLTLSFSTQSFLINQRNFILDLANSSYSSITTKMHIFNDGSQLYETIEFEKICQEFLSIQNKGAHLADFAGLWAIPLDMLPSDLHKNKIKIFTMASKENRHPDQHNEDICDVDSGNMVKDNCSVQAWFLQPDDKIIALNQIAVNTNNNSCLMDLKLPFTDESLLEYPLKISDIIHITGKLNDNFIGYFRIHLLHNWKEPDSIMGETILTILIRRNYINFESKYNFTKHEQDSKETILDKIRQNLTDIDKKFSLNIHADSNGNYRIILNCKNENAFVFTQAIDNPLKYTSTNYIRIEADPGVELKCYQIIRKPSTIATPALIPDPSYSLKLEYPTNQKEIYIIVKSEIPENATKFDINLIFHDGQQNKGVILAHFHANLNDNFYRFGRCKEKCLIWFDNTTIFNASDIVKQLIPGQQFFWIWLPHLFNDNGAFLLPTDALFIDNTVISRTIALDRRPNYIQFKGDLLVQELSVEPIKKIYSFESPFKQFNQIKFILKLLGNQGIKIDFACLDQEKCEKSLDINMQLYIGENYVSLISNDEEINQKLNNMPYNQTINLFMYSNQFEYRIFKDDELILIANYWQFPTPDKFDTIIIEGLVFLPEGKPMKEWKQLDSDITLPFTYILDKPLEIGSSIQIKMKFQIKNEWHLSLLIYLQNNAYVFDEHFGTNVLSLDVSIRFFDRTGKRGVLDIEVGQKITKNKYENVNYNINSTIYEFGEFIKFEIIVHEEYYQIILDGKVWFNNITHMLPVGMVNYMRIENNGDAQMQVKIIEANITWPSDSSSNWMTAPGKKQIELSGNLSMPTNENLIMKLNRPLRINDAIMFKGKFHNGLKEFRDLYIELFGNTNKDETILILYANLEYKPKSGPNSGDSRIYNLYANKFDEQGKVVRGARLGEKELFDQSNDEFDVKIRIGADNKFYLQIGNSKEANITNDGLFWAVQYIKFRFEEVGFPCYRTYADPTFTGEIIW